MSDVYSPSFVFHRLLYAVWCLVFVVSGLVSVSYAQDYRLGPDDVIKITVYREAELDREVRVSADGYISFPLLGKVKTEGLTVSEFEKNLTERLRRYIKKPQVTVFINEYSTITVTGQVVKPDSYPLKGQLTVLEAIGLAGGFTEFAGQDDVTVIRIEDGKKKTIKVSVADISKTGDKTKDVALKRGDIVFVPEEYSTVTVTGEVEKPDSYPLRGELTVLEAIGLAGGFTKFASRNKVKIMRIENGEEKTITVRVADISKTGNKAKDVALKLGDIVFVPESLF